MGAAANHLEAQLGHALLGCELPSKHFLSALKALTALRRAVDQIRSSRHTISAEEAASGLAHYTDAGGLTSMLDNEAESPRNVIRLYNIAYVNDPKEGKRLRAFSQGKLKNPLADFFSEQENMHEAISWQGQDFLVFVACFSLESDSLNLWRFYGRNGTGFSVVSPLAAFDTDPTHGILHGGGRLDRTKSAPPITLYKVLYDDKSAQEALDDLTAPLAEVTTLMGKVSTSSAKRIREISAAIVSELLYLYKDKDYGDEKEVRAVEARTLSDPELRQHPKTLDHFAKLFIETAPILFQQPGSSIVIGPKVDNSAAITLDIKHRLEKCGLGGCEVSQSKVSYR
ncbi:DUF2971 domain-containing protein [Roseateles oligotrophus]|uniref:DUF2971 domain-containing protein n=1 Tax=Roseateles oligotrophus TaxID=1769250 RepID=A0ABT2YN52_9BURK|nr:DUF2971 domain-containing protein [Roseateles oligotrophus]MCV2371356.1 DUF2971 domain-containing protein [Roseateles oligotrophus]